MNYTVDLTLKSFKYVEQLTVKATDGKVKTPLLRHFIERRIMKLIDNVSEILREDLK